MSNANILLGRGWAFPPAFDQHSKAVEIVKNEKDILESLRILLSTTPGERPMEPSYGCDLSPLAFRRLDLNLETFMVNNIKQAIRYYEPRIRVNSIKLNTDVRLEGAVNINIDYNIRATNVTQNMVYPYSFEKTILT